MSKSIIRLHEYLSYKGIRPTRFEKEIGLSNGYLGIQLKRNSDLGESIIMKLVDNCRELSLEWLLTGKGEMLKKHDDLPQKECVNCSQKDEFITHLKQEIDYLRKKVDELTPPQTVQEQIKKAM